MKLRIFLLEEKLAGYEKAYKNKDNQNELDLILNEKKISKKNLIYDLSCDYEEDNESLNSNLNSKYFSPTTNIYNIETRMVYTLNFFLMISNFIKFNDIKDFRAKRKFGMSKWKTSTNRTWIRWKKVYIKLKLS